jgi:hypothetical protein
VGTEGGRRKKVRDKEEGMGVQRWKEEMDTGERRRKEEREKEEVMGHGRRKKEGGYGRKKKKGTVWHKRETREEQWKECDSKIREQEVRNVWRRRR